jgi:hypothetical protein
VVAKLWWISYKRLHSTCEEFEGLFANKWIREMNSEDIQKIKEELKDQGRT